MKLDQKLKYHRGLRAKTAQQVADELGIPVSTYRGYEYGARIPADLIPTLCEYFDVTPNEFFETKIKKIDSSQHEKLKYCIEDLKQTLGVLSEIYTDRIIYNTD